VFVRENRYASGFGGLCLPSAFLDFRSPPNLVGATFGGQQWLLCPFSDGQEECPSTPPLRTHATRIVSCLRGIFATFYSEGAVAGEQAFVPLRRCRRLATDADRLNRMTFGFVKLASIRVMLRKLCNSL
jgi:hypothetical protein